MIKCEVCCFIASAESYRDLVKKCHESQSAQKNKSKVVKSVKSNNAFFSVMVHRVSI